MKLIIISAFYSSNQILYKLYFLNNIIIYLYHTLITILKLIIMVIS